MGQVENDISNNEPSGGSFTGCIEHQKYLVAKWLKHWTKMRGCLVAKWLKHWTTDPEVSGFSLTIATGISHHCGKPLRGNNNKNKQHKQKQNHAC